jgi:hypothetical protein
MLPPRVPRECETDGSHAGEHVTGWILGLLLCFRGSFGCRTCGRHCSNR